MYHPKTKHIKDINADDATLSQEHTTAIKEFVKPLTDNGISGIFGSAIANIGAGIRQGLITTIDAGSEAVDWVQEGVARSQTTLADSVTRAESVGYEHLKNTAKATTETAYHTARDIVTNGISVTLDNLHITGVIREILEEVVTIVVVTISNPFKIFVLGYTLMKLFQRLAIFMERNILRRMIMWPETHSIFLSTITNKSFDSYSQVRDEYMKWAVKQGKGDVASVNKRHLLVAYNPTEQCIEHGKNFCRQCMRRDHSNSLYLAPSEMLLYLRKNTKRACAHES